MFFFPSAGSAASSTHRLLGCYFLACLPARYYTAAAVVTHAGRVATTQLGPPDAGVPCAETRWTARLDLAHDRRTHSDASALSQYVLAASGECSGAGWCCWRCLAWGWALAR